MAELSRKQRQLAQREQLLLETARRLLLEIGYSALTMERIAEAAEYSKGTVYNHFPCKEEMIAEIGSRILHGKAVFLERASAFKGGTRERLTALGEGAALFQRLYPEDVSIIQLLHSPVFMRKVSEKLCGRALAQERRAVKAVNVIVLDAVATGDLDADASLADQVTFGIWCVTEGSLRGSSREGIFEDLGLKKPYRAMGRTLDLLADGWGWRPTSAQFDSDSVRTRVRQSIFAEELRRLQRGPKVSNQ